MDTTGHSRVAEAQLLLHQALRLLEDHARVARDAGARATLTDLAAELAHEAVATLRMDLADLDEGVAPRPQGWAG